MDERLERLLRAQLTDGFPDLRGAEAAITLPLSERLLNDILTEFLPRSAPVSEVSITPEPSGRFTVRFRLGSSTLLPRMRVGVSIEAQPDLPALPILVLRLDTAGLMMLAGPVLRLLKALPAGVTVKDDRIHVDLRALAEQHGAGPLFDYLDALRVDTVPGAAILTIRGKVR